MNVQMKATDKCASPVGTIVEVAESEVQEYERRGFVRTTVGKPHPQATAEAFKAAEKKE